MDSHCLQYHYKSCDSRFLWSFDLWSHFQFKCDFTDINSSFVLRNRTRRIFFVLRELGFDWSNHPLYSIGVICELSLDQVCHIDCKHIVFGPLFGPRSRHIWSTDKSCSLFIYSWIPKSYLYPWSLLCRASSLCIHILLCDSQLASGPNYRYLQLFWR